MDSRSFYHGPDATVVQKRLGVTKIQCTQALDVDSLPKSKNMKLPTSAPFKRSVKSKVRRLAPPHFFHCPQDGLGPRSATRAMRFLSTTT